MPQHTLRLAAIAFLSLGALCPAARAQPSGVTGDLANPEQTLWRARTRLERGDVFLAQPLYEQLYKSQREQSGPLFPAIAEGLAICEIARGQAPAAVAPWLDALRLRIEGAAPASSANLPPLMDEQTGLAPLLAPVWLAGPELAPLVDDNFVNRYLAPASNQPAAIARLGRLYRWAALFELGLPLDESEVAEAAASGEKSPADESLAPSIALVRMIVQSRIGSESERSAARAQMELALSAEIESSVGSWREAWLRVGLGRSLLREADEPSRNEGMLQLMHLPARFAETQPRLAALALAEVARELARRGEQPTSESIAALLHGPLADPDALRWLREPDRTRDNPQDSPAPTAPPEKETHGS